MLSADGRGLRFSPVCVYKSPQGFIREIFPGGSFKRRYAHREGGDLLNEKKRVLSIDLETYSDVDLGSCGVYRYVEGDFHILLFAYAFDDEEVRVVDMACGEKLPQEVVNAVHDPDTINQPNSVRAHLAHSSLVPDYP